MHNSIYYHGERVVLLDEALCFGTPTNLSHPIPSLSWSYGSESAESIKARSVTPALFCSMALSRGRFPAVHRVASANRELDTRPGEVSGCGATLRGMEGLSFLGHRAKRVLPGVDGGVNKSGGSSYSGGGVGVTIPFIAGISNPFPYSADFNLVKVLGYTKTFYYRRNLRVPGRVKVAGRNRRLSAFQFPRV